MVAKLTAVAGKVREVGSNLRQKAQPSAGGAELVAAQIALADEVARSIDELLAPDVDAVLQECAGSIAAELASADGDVADAMALASEVVDTLATLDGAERRTVLAQPWPPLGIAAVLQQAVGVERLVLATDLVAAREGNSGLALAAGGIMEIAIREADDADAVLAGDSVVSALLAAIGGSAAVSTYTALLGTDVGRLLRTPVPALLSCPVAMLHAAAAARFGDEMATVLARAALLQRGLVAKLDLPLLAVLQSPEPQLADTVDEYVAQVVAAGHTARSIAEDDEDPDELLTQRGAALNDAGTLEACFRDPTPDDPLGTLPRVTVTALGTALLTARSRRATDYDWERLAELEETRPDDYLLLIEDERMEVMDLVL